MRLAATLRRANVRRMRVSARACRSARLPRFARFVVLQRGRFSTRPFSTSGSSPSKSGPETPASSASGASSNGSGSSANSSSAGASSAAEEEVRGEEHAFEEDDRELLLATALPHARTLGFTEDAVAAAVRDLADLRPGRFNPAVAGGLLPRGPVELVDYFLDESLENMRAKFAGAAEMVETMSTKDKLKTAVRVRLSMVTPYVAVWPAALALAGQPQNLPYTLPRLGECVDEMWHLAGDRSSGTSWYSKRAALSGVYAATELYMLTDRSANFEQTWSFLGRRLDDMSGLARLPSEVEATLRTVFDVVVRATAHKR